MSTIIDYILLVSYKSFELEKIVKTRIFEGWQPLGGISYGQSEVLISGSKKTQPNYVQAMVKYEQPKTNSI